MTFDAQGDYTVTVSAEDKAGNKAVTRTVKFRIDKTAPVISISGMNDRQTTAVNATISIDEAFSFAYENNNLAADAFNVTITRKTDGTAASNIATLGTSSFRKQSTYRNLQLYRGWRVHDHSKCKRSCRKCGSQPDQDLQG